MRRFGIGWSSRGGQFSAVLAVAAGALMACTGQEPALTPPPPRTVTPSAPPTTPIFSECPSAELEGPIRQVVPIADGIDPILTVTHCRNGYALVVLTVDPESLPLREVVDPLPVYAKRTDGTWQVINYGTDISCADIDVTPADTVEACRQLGLT
jgi:hypothetical protein